MQIFGRIQRDYFTAASERDQYLLAFALQVGHIGLKTLIAQASGWFEVQHAGRSLYRGGKRCNDDVPLWRDVSQRNGLLG